MLPLAGQRRFGVRVAQQRACAACLKAGPLFEQRSGPGHSGQPAGHWVPDVLNRNWPLSMAMVWRLQGGRGIAAESRIRQTS